MKKLVLICLSLLFVTTCTPDKEVNLKKTVTEVAEAKSKKFIIPKEDTESTDIPVRVEPIALATSPSLQVPIEVKKVEKAQSGVSTDTDENSSQDITRRAPIGSNDFMPKVNPNNAFHADTNRSVILDESRGIMWTAEISPTMMTWHEALSYCLNLEIAKYSDWRFPTKDELSSIINPHLAEKIQDSNVAPLYSPFSIPSNGYLFSETLIPGYKDRRWIMNLRNGHMFNGQGYKAYVMAVRNIGVGTTKKSTLSITEMAMPAVVQIMIYDITGTQCGLGSGFFIAPGKILTNAHVVEGAYSAEVLSDTEHYDKITVLKSDGDIDLALLMVEDRSELTLQFQETQEIRPGQRIVTIGNPMGLTKTVSDGLVSAIRSIPGQFQGIQISAPISPGSSGGPLLSQEGRVIGIVSATLYEGQNLNFAIGIRTIEDFLSKPDDPQPLHSAGSRVMWRVVLKWVGNIILGLIALAFGGGWWIILIAIFLFYGVFWIFRGLFKLVTVPFRKKQATVNYETNNNSYVYEDTDEESRNQLDLFDSEDETYGNSDIEETYGTEIVTSTNNIQKEISVWEAHLSEKENEASDLSIQIQDITIAMNLFLGEYYSRIGILYVKLDKLKLRIKEYEHRIDIAQGRKLTPEDLESIETEVDETFSQERCKVDDLENEASESAQEYERHLEEEKRQPFDHEFQQELKKIYRWLALKFHPDKAKDAKQARKFQKIFAAIAEAYRNGDLETLNKYKKQAEREEKIAKETPKEKLVRLKKDYENLLGIVAKLRAELEDLKANETYKLKKKVDQAKKEDRDLLQELAAEIKDEIAENQAILDELVIEYKDIIGDMAY